MSDHEFPGRTILEILDSDPVAAEAKFRRLIGQLKRWLEWKGCPDPEGAASESVLRAVKQLDRLVIQTGGDLRAYIFGIARKVALEGGRTAVREQQLNAEVWSRRTSGGSEEQMIDRLTLGEIRRFLDPSEWQLILRYATWDDHDRLCRELGVTPGTLRVKIFRIRQKIREWIPANTAADRVRPGHDGGTT